MAVAEDATPEKRGRGRPFGKKTTTTEVKETTPEKRVKDTPTRSRRGTAANYVELTPSPVKRPRADAEKKDADFEVTPPKVSKRETPVKRGRKSVSVPTTPTAASKGMMTPKRNPLTTPSRRGMMTPGTKARTNSVVAPGTQLEAARARLHVSAVPDSLPCRDNEFTSIFNFVRGNLTEGE